MTTVENLQTALDLLREHGVGQGVLYDPLDKHYCALGAVYAARTDLRGNVITEDDTWAGHGDPYEPTEVGEWSEVSELAVTIRNTASSEFMVAYADCADNFLVFKFNDCNHDKVEKLFINTIARISQ